MRAFGGRNLRVGACPLDQVLDALHARVALLLQILVAASGCVPAAAAATAAAADVGNWKVTPATGLTVLLPTSSRRDS